jgi:hypothetical protein
MLKGWKVFVQSVVLWVRKQNDAFLIPFFNFKELWTYSKAITCPRGMPHIATPTLWVLWTGPINPPHSDFMKGVLFTAFPSLKKDRRFPTHSFFNPKESQSL